MSNEDDGTIHMPSKQEYILTGTFGILLYSGILYLSIASAWAGFKSKSTRRFFGSIGIMALLELPRYFDLAVAGDYTSRVCYSFHIVAGIFFFLSFSIVCRQWSGLLQLGSYFRMVYGYHGLIISNASFALVDFVAVVFCLTSKSLDQYFFSLAFVVVTFVEGFRNCVYSGFLTYYGLKLVKRFWHFSRLERQVTRRYCCYIADDQVFTRVVLRLTGVLFLTTMCFVFRMTMLVAKMAELHSPQELTSTSFTLFGFWWFAFSDFIPRALPSLAFIFLMRTKRPARDQVNKGLSQAERGYESNTFQFVRLEGADRDEGGDNHRNDPFPRSYSFSGYSDDEMGEIDFQTDHSVTKPILHHDQFTSNDRGAFHSADGFSLTSFRDLQRATATSGADPPSGGSVRFDDLATLNYSDDEVDYETVAAAGDDDEDEEDIAGDKAIDSLLNLLTYTTRAGTMGAASQSSAAGANSRTGSYSGEAVANASYHQSLSAASIAANSTHSNSSSRKPSVSDTDTSASQLGQAETIGVRPAVAVPILAPPPSASAAASTAAVGATARSLSTEGRGGRGLGAAIKRMQLQQQLKSPPQPSPASSSSSSSSSQHTIDMHPDDLARDETESNV